MAGGDLTRDILVSAKAKYFIELHPPLGLDWKMVITFVSN
jgi:hypothetical protein